MTRKKLIKIFKSGAVVSLLVSTASAITGLAGIMPPDRAMIATAIGTLMATFSQSLPALILEILDEEDVNLGEDRPSSTGT